MIIVWILSYFAVTAVATLLLLKYQDEKIEKVDLEMRLYGHAQPRTTSNRHAYHS
jgi:hypothetical protein